MPGIFFRLHTDHTRQEVALENAFAGAGETASWLIGGGPSLAKLPYEEIAASPAPKMTINLAGTRLLRPNFWTSYDATSRFHRSIYLDPCIMKFVHRRRAMDLVPETTFKVCECPNLYFFERDARRGFADFLGPQHAEIVDWADSMVQAIDLLYRLGFRTIYLAGCEMRVRPSREQIRRGAERGVAYDRDGLLSDFVRKCAAAGLSAKELDKLDPAEQYHFPEHKPIQAAADTDLHYFRVVQWLRLSRRSMALAGLKLISVTPHSRLNDHLPYEPVRRAVKRILRETGDPRGEEVAGLYSQSGARLARHVGPMRDYRPLNWDAKSPADRGAKREGKNPGEDRQAFVVEREGLERINEKQRLATALARSPGEVDVVEEG